MTLLTIEYEVWGYLPKMSRYAPLARYHHCAGLHDAQDEAERLAAPGEYPSTKAVARSTFRKRGKNRLVYRYTDIATYYAPVPAGQPSPPSAVFCHPNPKGQF